MRRRITLIELPPPRERDLNDELQWLGSSLGLFGDRDRDRSCFRGFITLVKDAKRSPLRSDQIAEQLELTRGTVVHHINSLMNAGIVNKERGGYTLRKERLEELIHEMRRDIDAMFVRMDRVSKEIDEWLGL